MHKFTEVASWERGKQISCHSPHFLSEWFKSYEVVKSNLPPEHKRMHKLTEVANGEREKQISCHSPYVVSEWLKVMK